MLVYRVIRFILARLIIDSNRWSLISYKQLLHLAHVFASKIYGTMMRLGCGKVKTIDNDTKEVIDDNTSSNAAYDNDMSTC